MLLTLRLVMSLLGGGLASFLRSFVGLQAGLATLLPSCTSALACSAHCPRRLASMGLASGWLWLLGAQCTDSVGRRRVRSVFCFSNLPTVRPFWVTGGLV